MRLFLVALLVALLVSALAAQVTSRFYMMSYSQLDDKGRSAFIVRDYVGGEYRCLLVIERYHTAMTSQPWPCK